MAEITLAIIGLRRLGTSFGLAVKRYMARPGAEHKLKIIGSDESAENRAAAKKLEAIDQEARTLDAAVMGADLILLTLPYSKYEEYLEAMAPDLKEGAVIIDFSPLKMRSIARARKYLPKDKGEFLAYSVAATAILNSAYLYDTVDTPESARADLFDHGTLILSPDAKVRGEAISLVSDFAALLGMETHFTDPLEHDGLVAAMEALPLLTNLALFRTVSNNRAWDDLKRLGNPIFALAAAGLGTYSAEDAAETINSNRDATLRYLDALVDELKEIRSLLVNSDEPLLTEAFGESLEKHEKWLHERGRTKQDAAAADKEESEKVSMGSLLSQRLFGRFGRLTKDKD